MIVSSTLDTYSRVVSDFNLNQWQSGVVQNILSSEIGSVKSINMGRMAGHSYLATCLSVHAFPLQTKVYTFGLMHTLISKQVQRPVDVLHEQGFPGYHGDEVDLFVFDMGDRPIQLYKQSLMTLRKSMPQAKILLLQPGIVDF